MFLIPLQRVFFFGNVLSPSTSRSWPRALVYSSGPMIAIWSPDPTSRALSNSGRLGGSSRPAPLRPTGGELGRTVGGQEGLLVYLPRASQSGPGTRSPSRQNCTRLLFGISFGINSTRFGMHPKNRKQWVLVYLPGSQHRGRTRSGSPISTTTDARQLHFSIQLCNFLPAPLKKTTGNGTPMIQSINEAAN